jgi:uncharacterized protein (TIGR00297 family)
MTRLRSFGASARQGRHSQHSETARQIVHMAMGGFALVLRWLPWWQAVALAAAALGFNLFLLPRLRVNLYRPGDRERGVHGIVWYPLAVLLLVVSFPRRPDIAAAAWGILAIGDGLATLAGRAIGGPRWPWNREKTLSGSAAFAIGGAAAGVFLGWWCRPAVAPPPALAFTIAAPILAAVSAAFVETIPVRLDDNLSVAATAGAVLWLASLVSLAQLPAGLAIAVARLPAAVALNALVAWAGHRVRTVSASGAVAGALIGVTIFLGTGWQGWILLLATFIAASVASRLGLKRKMLLGIAEERGGRRGPGNAIANTGVAAIAAIVALAGTSADMARLAFAAALVAGGSDTIASEIGKAWGRATWSVTSLKRVPPGTSGAMSLEGTIAGIAGALGLGAAAVALGLVPPAWLWAIVMGATAGSLLESWLGATLEAPGILNNDMLNFINTAAGALTALAITATLS